MGIDYTIFTMETLTEYAKASDNFLAHRLFKRKVLPELSTTQPYPISAVYLDLLEHFAISRKFVDQMISDYVEAGLLRYDTKTKKEFWVIQR